MVGLSVQRIDLKVNVSCCEGCRRKVMKAMSMKGRFRNPFRPCCSRLCSVPYSHADGIVCFIWMVHVQAC
jgi:hypothetical protein